MYVTLNQIKEAKAKLEGVIEKTPLLYSEKFSALSGNDIYLKLENLQKTGAFKVRGAFNKISSLPMEKREKGVVTFSAGNHGMGMAYSARALGIQATVVLPSNPVPSKKEAIISYGANIVNGGADSVAMYKMALQLQEEKGMEMIHPFDDPFTIAGQGTIGLEISEQLHDVDAIIVPVSGGGLIAGIAATIKAIKPSIEIIGVNAEGAQAMYQSLQKGHPITVDKVQSIADGLMVNKPGELTFLHTQKYVDDLVLVSEKEIAETVAFMSDYSKLVVEPSGAAALAAMLYNRTQLKNRKVAVIVSGGNVSLELYTSLINAYNTKFYGEINEVEMNRN